MADAMEKGAATTETRHASLEFGTSPLEPSKFAPVAQLKRPKGPTRVSTYELSSLSLSSSEFLEGDIYVVDWNGLHDPQHPYNISSWRRWTLIWLVSAITFMAGLNSSMFAPAVPELMKHFGSTNQVMNSFVVTIFLLGMAVGPLGFAPLSELYGRASIQHIGTLGFLAFTVGCTVSDNLVTLTICRFFQGVYASVPLSQGGGIISDMVPQHKRGFAMALFTTGTLLGPGKSRILFLPISY